MNLQWLVADESELKRSITLTLFAEKHTGEITGWLVLKQEWCGSRKIHVRKVVDMKTILIFPKCSVS
jgi:hypothetical protein